jgi:hypothetical protein
VTGVTGPPATVREKSHVKREEDMAKICVEATPSDDLDRYELKLDNDDTDFVGADGKGCLDLDNNVCGDGTRHRLYYALFGPSGAKLTVKISCDDAEIGTYEIEMFPPGGEIQGNVRFDL